MTLHMFSVAAAKTVDWNPWSDTWIEESKYFRRVKRIGMAGSAAVGDVRFGLWYGNTKVGQVYVSTVGAVCVVADDMKTMSSKSFCPPNAELKLVIEAGTVDTNPVYGCVEIEEFTPKLARAGRRGFSRGAGGFRRRGFARGRY